MAWILIIIQLLPAVLEIIQLIIAAINRKPREQRRQLREELTALLRKHIKRPRGKKPVLRTSEAEVVQDLEELLKRLS